MEKKELVSEVRSYQDDIAQTSHNIQQFIDEATSVTSAFNSDEYDLRQNMSMVKSSLDSALKYIKYARAILEF